MLYREISRILAFYLWILILPLLIPLSIAIYCEGFAPPGTYPQPPSALAFILTILFTFLLGLILYGWGRKGMGTLFRREALLLVIIVYLITPAIGALPFVLNRTLDNPVDAYFEAVSGYTTTGASVMEAKKYDPATGKEIPIVRSFTLGSKKTYSYYGTIKPVIDPQTDKVLLTDLEAISPALIFWRSFMQWLGGGGVIVLFVAILPALGVGGKILFQTEMTGPSKESMMPRIKETASRLWKIYLGLTLLQVFLLMVTNERVNLFNALTISFATLSTGGFSPVSNGLPQFDSAFTDWVVIVFMILGSISFSIYFYCMRGKFYRLKDPELKAFIAIILFSAGLSTLLLMGQPKNLLIDTPGSEGVFNFFEALRYGTFQVVSAQTSTGFATANYDLWPFSVQVLMLVLFFVGGMAGSTAGGLKVIRQQTFFRIMLNKIESIFRPDTVRTYRIGHMVIDNSVAMTILCFFMVAATLTILGTFLLVLDGVDPETSLTSIACMLNNVGFAFREGGPTESFAFLSNFGKLLSSLWMIAGRLEYFAILIAFVPAFWRTSY